MFYLYELFTNVFLKWLFLQGSQEPILSNKRLYPNFARTNPSNYKAVTKILELVEARRWKRVTIMYQPDRFWKTMKRHLAHHLKQKGIKISRKIKIDKDFDEVFDINSDQYEGDTIAKSTMNADSQGWLTIFLHQQSDYVCFKQLQKRSVIGCFCFLIQLLIRMTILSKILCS